MFSIMQQTNMLFNMYAFIVYSQHLKLSGTIAEVRSKDLQIVVFGVQSNVPFSTK